MRILVLVLALVLVASAANAQTWRKGTLGAAGGVALTEPVTVGNINPEIYFHIPNTDTTNSDDFIVPRNYLVTVLINAYYESTGANGVALTLERYYDNGPDASGANNHSTVENTTLTGAGDTAFVWDVPAGKYFISVTDGPDTGTAVVTVMIQRVLLKH